MRNLIPCKGTMQGLTLVELLITLVIAAILLGVGIPNFTELIRNNQTASQANKFTRAITYARSEAIRNGVNTVLCRSSSGAGCTAGGWQSGWIIFTDENGDNTVNGADQILQVSEGLDDNFTLSSAGGNGNISFTSQGALNSNVGDSFKLCRPDGDATLSREIFVGLTGHATIDIADSCP